VSSLINYENYSRPFAGGFGQFAGGFGQETQGSWFRRNWTWVLQVIGLAFVAGGMVAKKYVDREVPQQEKITPDDWQRLVTSVQQIYPRMPRGDIERKLCEVFGARSPYCTNVGLPLPVLAAEAPSIPSWLWIAALGVGAVLLLK